MRRSEIRPGCTYEGRSGPPRTVVSVHEITWCPGPVRLGVRYLHPGETLHAPKRGCVIEVFARWAVRETGSPA